MKITKYGINELIEREGSRHHVYNDVAGLPTIGVGHLLTRDELMSGKIVIDGHPVKMVRGLSDAQVKALLEHDLKPIEKAVNDYVKVELTRPQYDTLVSFVFNIGIWAFRKSTLLKVLNDGNYDQVPEQLKRWVYAGGKIRRGLQRRRKEEIENWSANYDNLQR